MVENSNPISAAQNSGIGSGNFLDPTGSLQRNINALQARARQIRPSLYFPQDYQNIFHYMTFTALKFESITRTSTISTDRPIVSNRNAQATRQLTSITLPMPDQLNTRYNAAYADEPISATGEVFATGISNVNLQKANENFRNGRYAEGAQALAQQAGGGAIAGGTAADAFKNALGTAAQTGVGNVFGFGRNPQKVLQFNGVDFRTHQFSFKLTPKNFKEAVTIQQIILAFKKHMLPKYGLGKLEDLIRRANPGGEQPPSPATGNNDLLTQVASTSRAFFEYPDVFQITFNNEKSLFTIGESVLMDFSIDYHPQNYPAYVRSLSSPNLAHPASITIALTFKETDIVTKEQVDEYFR
jgi:hypothetical protein